MTFKHIKFEDSPVMRLLERQASKLGVVQEPIVKEASVEINLTPSDILIKNIVNLCAGLKAAGFSKHANELENKFLSFKQAQTLYETSKETGDDLVDNAHPNGSAKLDGVDSELAIVETILDQQLKSIKMTEKMPTGKLASSNDVLKAVKLVLAQEASKEALVLQAKSMIGSALNYYEKVKSIAKKDFLLPQIELSNPFPKAFNNPTNIDYINSCITTVNNWFAARKPSLLSGTAVSDNTWNQISGLQNKIISFLQTALSNANTYNKIISSELSDEKASRSKEEAPVREGVTTMQDSRITQFLSQINASLSKLNTWYALIVKNSDLTQDDKNTAANFLIPKINALNVIIAEFSRLNEQEQIESLNRYVSKVEPLLKDLPEFKQLWIN